MYQEYQMKVEIGGFKYPLHCGLWLKSVNVTIPTSRHCEGCHTDYEHGVFFRQAQNGMYHGNQLIVCCSVKNFCIRGILDGK